MEELKQSREETAKTRQELGAEDVKPGEVEGMRDESGKTGRSKAMEKRKRELEERRQMLEAKRRKTKSAGGDAASDAHPPANTHGGATEHTGSTTTQLAAPDPFSALGAHSKAALPPTPKPVDPFAVLEGAAQDTRKDKGKAKMATPAATETDSFLAQLEQEFLGSRIKKKT